MTISELENFYLRQEEPNQSCMLSLRKYIIGVHKGISQEWKYKLPFFYLNDKMFCYLWKQKKGGAPYIGFTDGLLLKHPLLIQGERKRMKILEINPEEDLPIKALNEIFEEALKLRLTN